MRMNGRRGPDSHIKKVLQVLLWSVSMCIVGILLSFAVSLDGDRFLNLMQTYSAQWKSVNNELESVKAIEAQIMQMREDLIQLRRKLLPKGLSMPNFALESQGARVVHADPSEQYRSRSQPPFLTFLGIPILYTVYTPRTAIQGHTRLLVPGQCWCFAGQQGELFISLSQPVIVSHVTLGHISRENSLNGLIHSAPQHFSVSGFLSEDGVGTHLGTFEYDSEAEPFQTFELPSPKQTYRYVKLQILDNWGHQEYTCVYSFKVHGTIKQYSYTKYIENCLP
ncbi:SUN domain-containing protein 2-like [Eucyclogobius newberryi]|uniref:SUN domain-containing protein 2-like n=1 Tax=Eucyclogobius newberryi TaxID=166745 RepID=UPI003B5A8870